jgi:PPOX class probable F420-dependent enzyme
MNLDQARDFASRNHRAVLATFRRDGSPQLSPVTVDVDPDGMVVISSRETAMKTKNLRRDPRATLCVMNDGFYGSWVQIDGRAAVVSLPEAMQGLVDYYRRVAGEHPDWDDYRVAMERDQRVLIRVHVDRAGPDRSG